MAAKFKKTVAAGVATVVELTSSPCNLAVEPGAAATLLVEYSTTMTTDLVARDWQTVAAQDTTLMSAVAAANIVAKRLAILPASARAVRLTSTGGTSLVVGN